jgi:hypothetical protein
MRGFMEELTAHNHLNIGMRALAYVTKLLVPTRELTAEATPANPKKGAYGGQDDIICKGLTKGQVSKVAI